jgi:NADPH:quinone reductase-like Zn-dependent oxidoreductase
MRSAEQRAAAVPAFVADLLPVIASGRIRPVIDKVYPFDQLAAAKEYMESNRHLGKIVLVMPASTKGLEKS